MTLLKYLHGDVNVHLSPIVMLVYKESEITLLCNLVLVDYQVCMSTILLEIGYLREECALLMSIEQEQKQRLVSIARLQ